MSTDCENLLKRFLVLNPTKRASLEVSNILEYHQVLPSIYKNEISYKYIPTNSDIMNQHVILFTLDNM